MLGHQKVSPYKMFGHQKFSQPKILISCQKKCSTQKCFGAKKSVTLQDVWAPKIFNPVPKSVSLKMFFRQEKCHYFRCLGTKNFHNQKFQFHAKKSV
jgi:hypothetical protein